MSRSLARRGASVLVAAALLGGGLALGGGTASAAEATGSASGIQRDSLLDLPAALVLTLGRAAGSVHHMYGACFDTGVESCPSHTELLLDLLLGNRSS
ncbi:hypothetical protein ABIC28_005205 [Rhodococcus sp. PvR044]|jgi:hypothetical protein|uniref:hypothetical protein n=1 Tax=Rhodococcus sp. PvR044 TaxID=3156402 RepID=UPI003394EE81